MIAPALTGVWNNKTKIAAGSFSGFLFWAMIIAQPLVIHSIEVGDVTAERGVPVEVTAFTDKALWAVRWCKATAAHNNMRDSHGTIFQQDAPKNYNDGSIALNAQHMMVPASASLGPAVIWRSVEYECFSSLFKYTAIPKRSDWARIVVIKERPSYDNLQ